MNIPLLKAELAAFARQAGAGAKKQIVLVLERAGCHSTQRLRPEPRPLAVLAAVSARVQPEEYLWWFTSTVLVSSHFASIDELEDAQATRCVALQAHRHLVRSTALFHWWPQRLHKR